MDSVILGKCVTKRPDIESLLTLFVPDHRWK